MPVAARYFLVWASGVEQRNWWGVRRYRSCLAIAIMCGLASTVMLIRFPQPVDVAELPALPSTHYEQANHETPQLTLLPLTALPAEHEHMSLRPVRGMNDLLPADADLWHHVEACVADVLARYGYREIRLPLLEYTELFKRSIGEVTDIVEKEMYTFDDRNGVSLTLRPEATASMVTW